ncbi:MAG: pyridoxamine 5'-phosphate oxidase family protein [Candidatus Cloacimonetes bacterium]|nr:pyridoxamine 5'-phosphate oxidase family protein [Candidatus Cloacimonadota bacterium]NLO12178.1 pyridoxamine 5'-phosphate oxidase family protein [Candidatus Cloacimonadota bacterium]
MARNSESALLGEILSWLRQNQYVYLATCDKKQPRVRPIVLYSFEDRYFFTTFSGNSKVAQVNANRWVEVCVPLQEDGHNGYLRLSGIAKVVSNSGLKAEAAEYCYFFDQFFGGYDDPDYALIEFEPDYVEYMRPGENHTQGCSFRRN